MLSVPDEMQVLAAGLRVIFSKIFTYETKVVQLGGWNSDIWSVYGQLPSLTFWWIYLIFTNINGYTAKLHQWISQWVQRIKILYRVCQDAMAGGIF